MTESLTRCVLNILVSIHALRRVRQDINCLVSFAKTFQSTRPLRSATMARTRFSCRTLFQSTHSLRSATCIYCITRFVKLVSIHALRRVRHTSFVPSFSLYGFNPRTPKSATCPNYYFESSRSRFNPRTPKSATAKGRFYRHFCLHLWGHSPTDAVYSYSCRDSLKFSLLSSWFLIGKKDVHYALALRTVSRHAFRHSFI